VPDLAAVAVTLTPVATLEAPIAMATRAGDDALYIAERAGQVRVLRGGQVQPAPLVDIGPDTTTDGERGLLGLTFSPDGQRLYLYFTDPNGAIRIDEFTLDGAAVRADSRRTLLVQEHPRLNHNGGSITFGPDGLLYLGLGDGGGQGDPNRNAQSLGSLLGKVLRIDPRPAGSAPYGVPADNPFAGDPAARGEIWAYGLRNPWRLSFDRETGDLWIGDVGQNELEEVDFLPGGGRGADLGWSDYEGTQLYNGEAGADGIPPLYEYGRDVGSSVTGGYVYRGQAIPALRGAYVFGDLTGDVWALAQSGGAVTGLVDLGVEVDTLVSFGEDAAGELYALSLDGDVLRLDPR
jgi:glucose/arabinose dehydrogenase